MTLVKTLMHRSLQFLSRRSRRMIGRRKMTFRHATVKLESEREVESPGETISYK